MWWPFKKTTQKPKRTTKRDRLRVGDTVVVCDFWDFSPCMAMIGPPEPVGTLREVACLYKGDWAFKTDTGWIAYKRIVEKLSEKDRRVPDDLPENVGCEEIE